MNNADVTFNAWLVQPGNHRLLHDIKKTLAQMLATKINIQSWADLYSAFEVSVDKSEEARSLFNPIFAEHPPTKENGATRRQIMMYRGVPSLPAEKTTMPVGHKVTVIYRGQKIEKVVQDPSVEQTPIDIPDAPLKPKTARYYRGVKVSD